MEINGRFSSIKGGCSNPTFFLCLGMVITLTGCTTMTSLGIASRDGNVKVVRSLLEKSTEVNEKDNIGYTPLHYAAYHGHAEIVRLLLKRGADPKLRDKKGQTPLALATERGLTTIVHMLRKAEQESN